ncbi:alpha/beta hydrolase [Herminiimonas sp. CN]|uniref:RBBP9/YdeN family alpha/beta hydrolase n=1 Tax=Herminiimonas sp. CN TaxID=1349818 RepID=UPI000473EF2D|nr:alpha/beta hydrolase [Herminiimonas sp. CN]
MKHRCLSNYRVLIVPGLHNSGAGHWQTRWQQRYPAFERVEQEQWDRPELPRWSERLAQVLRTSIQPTLIVAHSFGCLTTLHAAGLGGFKLAGALLVAPADPEKFGVQQALRNARLACPAVVVGSANDPWMTRSRAAEWAAIWRCGFVNAGALGHINAESGLEDWPFGLGQLERLVRTMQASNRSGCAEESGSPLAASTNHPI